jgi:phosphoribosylformylglycinamidine synthase
MQSLGENNQIVFRYCNPAGEVHLTSNPNGATDNIAGICNTGRNVYGMMPHPERATSESLGNIDGRVILEAFTYMS